jgi:ribosomal protein S18 acetylase RimI-like enzyme
MDYTIRPARFDEYDLLGDIERSAGRRFGEVGLAELADAEPTDPEFIGAVGAFGGVFVAAQDVDDTPVGFILVGMLDRAAHIYELSVAEEHGRRGLGRRLIEEACRFAGAEGAPAVTLSAFRDIPWNGPLYEQLGFRYLDRSEWTPALYLVHDLEIRKGLQVERRAFMRWEGE